MSRPFPIVPLGDVTIPVERPEAAVPGRRYRQIGVRLWGKGAYEREPIDGSQTRYATLSRVETDDIVVNKIWARNGSVAVVPPGLSGCYGSSEFPTFVPVQETLEPRWFHWLTKTKAFWEQCDEKSRGTSGKNRIRPERFLEVQIPLPSLAEQRRIVARIEELAAKIEEGRALRRDAEAACDSLCRALLLDRSDRNPEVPMRELVRLREPDVISRPDETYHFAGVYCFGRGVFRGERKTGTEFSYVRLTRLRTGDFVYPKLMAWEGALGVVPPECDGLVVSPEFPVFEVHETRVLPETLDVYFRTPTVWPMLGGASTGTNVRRRRLHPTEFLAFKIRLPPMPVQERVRHVKANMDAVKRLQAETAADLDALLPAVLARAFAGKL